VCKAVTPGEWLTDWPIREKIEDKRLYNGERSITRHPRPLLVIKEKKPQNLLTSRPHNSALNAHYHSLSQQSDHSTQVKTKQ